VTWSDRCVSAAKREAVMIKPTMAVGIGLVCVFALVAGTRGLGILGAERGGRDAITSIDGGAVAAKSLGGGQSFAHVPASHAAYGWRYPSVFRWESSGIEQRPSAYPVYERVDPR